LPYARHEAPERRFSGSPADFAESANSGVDHIVIRVIQGVRPAPNIAF
jgi:hypothetical protein